MEVQVNGTHAGLHTSTDLSMCTKKKKRRKIFIDLAINMCDAATSSVTDKNLRNLENKHEHHGNGNTHGANNFNIIRIRAFIILSDTFISGEK